MANTGEMIDQCLDRMGAGRQSNTRLTAKILAQLNAVYATLCGMQNWEWLKARASLATTESGTYIALPTVVKAGVTVNAVSRVLFVVLDSTGVPLQYKPEFIDLVQEGTSLALRGPGGPRYWCVTTGTDGVTKELLIIPIVGAVDSLTVWYLRSFSSLKLVELTDVPAFDEEYHQFLVERAMTVLAAADGTFDPQVAGMAQREAFEIYRAMMHTSRKGQPPIRSLRWGGHGHF